MRERGAPPFSIHGTFPFVAKGKRSKKRSGASKSRKRNKRRKASKVARLSKPKRRRSKRRTSQKPSGGRIVAKRRRANKTAGKKSSGKKSGFPAWVKPTVSMVIGGGVGLVAMSLLPDAIAPYAPALGVLGAKFLGGGSWGKYAGTAAVVGGVTFLSRRKTVQVAAGALTAAKAALSGGMESTVTAGPAEVTGGSAASRGESILRSVGVK